MKRLEQISRELESLQDYQSSLDIKDIAERNLQVAIEACLEPKDNKGFLPNWPRQGF